MRYVTPDTPSTRKLESREKNTRREKEATMATLTPTPTPKQSPEKAAAHIAPAHPAQPVQPKRRPIRTYGSKKRTLEDGNDRAKRPRLSLSAASAAAPVSAVSTPTTTRPSTADRLIDEVSRQLQKEAAEAERRQTEVGKENKENQQEIVVKERPQTPKKSPRKALGIMRYFQPAVPRPRTPPQAAVSIPACSPAASISSMSSLSSCPSPTPSESVSSVQEEEEETKEEEKEALSPVVWREQARPKRRLTIRPEHVREDEASNEADVESEDEADSERLASTPIFKAFNGLSSSSRMRIQLGLASSTSTKKKTKTVQTTLSLSMDSGSVRECKECNILYNPLHDKDAKFHARYHASVVGRR